VSPRRHSGGEFRYGCNLGTRCRPSNLFLEVEIIGHELVLALITSRRGRGQMVRRASTASLGLGFLRVKIPGIHLQNDLFGTLVGLICVRVNPRGAAISCHPPTLRTRYPKQPVVPGFLSPNPPAAIWSHGAARCLSREIGYGRRFIRKKIIASTIRAVATKA
jgi:hypothetical protein